MNIQRILEITGGKPLNISTESKKIENFSIDSRKLGQGSFFVPLKGSKHDGHSFIEEALKKGAVGYFSEVKTPYPNGILVSNTLKALTEVAKYKRSLFKETVAITGTSGKTTTKELAGFILKDYFKIATTQGNYNNHIGLPLSLANSREDAEIGIFELGTNKKGDIPYLMEILKPDISVLTSVGYAHTEGLKTFEDIVYEKGAVFERVRFAVLPDNMLPYYEAELIDYITFGTEEDADIRILDIKVSEKGTTGTISYKNEKITITVPVINKAVIKNIATVSGILYALDINPIKPLEIFNEFKGLEGRGKLIKTEDKLIIDDTYNANPLSVYNAVQTLSSIKGKKILVLGDMLELGELSEALHRETGKVIDRSDVDEVYLYGEEVKFIKEEIKHKPVYHYKEKQELIQELKNKHNCVILIKGSRGMKMEEVLEGIV